MSCVVGLICDVGIIIAADTAGVNGHLLYNLEHKKVFCNKDFLFGCVGSVRMSQLLQFSFEPPDHPNEMPIKKYLCTLFMNAVRECFKKGGYAMEDTDKQERGGDFMFGYRGHLFTVYSDYQIMPVNGFKFNAIGCGAELALGSLYTTHQPCAQISDAHRRVFMALEAAAAFSTSVAEPFYSDVLYSGTYLNNQPESMKI